MYRVALFFAVLACSQAAFTGNLVDQARPLLQQSSQRTLLALQSQRIGKSAEDQSLQAGLIQQLQNQAAAVILQIQNAVNSGHAIAESVLASLQTAIQQLQALGSAGLEGSATVLQNMLQNILRPVFGVGRSTRRLNWLIQIVINALIASDHFQSLIESDPFMQCLKANGYEPNSDLVFGLLDNNLALQFVTEDEICVGCINSNGGMQHIVQTSPVIQYAYRFADTFSATNVLYETIIEHLGQDLGGQVNIWLQTSRATSKGLFTNLVSVVRPGLGNLGEHLQQVAQNIQDLAVQNLNTLQGLVQNFVQEGLVEANTVLQSAVQELIDFLKPYQQALGTAYVQIVEQLQQVFGKQ